MNCCCCYGNKSEDAQKYNQRENNNQIDGNITNYSEIKLDEDGENNENIDTDKLDDEGQD